jgi:hypothetical protein
LAERAYRCSAAACWTPAHRHGAGTLLPAKAGSLDQHLDTPVHLPAGARVVARDGRCLAVAARRQPRWVNAAQGKLLPDRLGAAL